MKHLGDITKIKGCDAPVVDCIIGGSPCQDLSVAGKRAGLAGERSGLYMEQIRIIKEMRHNDEQRGRTGESIRPRYMVWENVPGAFSSNQGKDFAAVLEEAVRVAEPEAPDVPVPEKGWPTSGCFLDEMGKWSVAWRVMDAQYWGVPQRRRRICLVADFNGLNAPKIVFGEAEHNGGTERGGGKPSVGHPGAKSQSEVQPFAQGVSRNLDESESARKATAGDAESGVGADDRVGIAYTVPAVTYPTEKYLFENHSQDSRYKGPLEVSPMLSAQLGTGGNNTPLVMEPIAYDGANITSPANASNPHPGDPCHTLSTDSRNILIEPTPIHDQATRFSGKRGDKSDGKGNGLGVGEAGDPMNTLTSGDRHAVCCCETFHCTTEDEIAQPLKARDYKDPLVIAYEEDPSAVAHGVDCRNATEYEEQTGSLQSSCCHNMNSNNVVRVRYIVRRLTPLECERLQGYPDGWTDIGEWVDSKGKKHKEADSPRYKALGNSIAIPPWKWVLKKLCACYERDATMASLFDGIGGFPYIWEQLNGKGSCLWASEIEEFPMAVTKLRFGG